MYLKAINLFVLMHLSYWIYIYSFIEGVSDIKVSNFVNLYFMEYLNK